jgi:hypothetical protein
MLVYDPVTAPKWATHQWGDKPEADLEPYTVTFPIGGAYASIRIDRDTRSVSERSAFSSD